MGGKLIKSIDLEYGLRLDMFDESKKMIGDRWLVILAAKLEIPIDNVFTNKNMAIDVNEIKGALGEKIVFKLKRERIFIDESEKDVTFNNIFKLFTDNSLSYIIKDGFSEAFVLKRFKEAANKYNETRK